MNASRLIPVQRQDYTPPAFLVDKLDLEFELLPDVTIVRARLHVRRNPVRDDTDSHLVLMGEGLVLLTLWCDGRRCGSTEYALEADRLTLFAVPDQCLIETEVQICPSANTALKGLYLSNGNFCTQCEAEGFRHITFFPDRPDVMTVITTRILADARRYPVLLSNGNLTDSGRLPDGRHWVQWVDPYRKPCYLFALVAGDYDCLADSFTTQSGRQVSLEIYTEKGNREKCAAAMQSLKNAMRWDEVAYGREYDLDVYMIVAVSDFTMGAMENRGLNIFNTKYILACPETATDTDFMHVEAVIGHEYFHNWTGNRITCRDWFQLSLKEGLTIFREQEFISDMTSPAVARIDEVDYLRSVQFSEDAGPLAHPVYPDSYIEIDNFYTATIYNKGAEVIRMIKTLVGDSVFNQGMALYFARFDGQAITIEDFVQVHEEVSGKNLQQFFRWYVTPGTPLLAVTDSYSPEKKQYTLHIAQSIPESSGQRDRQPLHIPVSTGLLDQQGREVWNGLLELTEQQQDFVFENMPSKPVPSLLRNFSAPVRLNYEYSEAELALLFRHDTDSFNRREAGFLLAINCILHQCPAKGLIEAFASVFQTCRDDNWLLAKMLQLPSEKFLAGLMPCIDVDGIHSARELLAQSLGRSLEETFLSAWQGLHEPHTAFCYDRDSAGRRALKNVCLGWLGYSSDKNLHETVIARQFNEALGNNMTDTIGALSVLVNLPGTLRENALAAFHAKFQHDPLVLDKWFALQAGSKLPGTLARVQALMQHPLFDIRNPNRVYALIGTFTSNAVQFHAQSGAGYEFLADQVMTLDTLNPQVAASMLKPLTAWRRYDRVRQTLMRHALERIAAGQKLSPDVHELVSKSLQSEESCHHVA